MKQKSKLNNKQIDFIQNYLNNNFIGHVYGRMQQDEFLPIIPNYEYDFMCSDCPSSWINDGKSEQDLYDPTLTYKLNNYTYRSDDFNKQDANKNFLYSGCSFTFGIGVPYESIWAYMLNDSIGSEKFLNLGIGGGSFESIIFDIYTYIKKFGKPKSLIVLFPPPIRVMAMNEEKRISIIPFRVIHMKDKEEKLFYKNNKNLLDYDLWIMKFYNMVTALELFLENLGVKFLWGCWDMNVNKIFSQVSTLKNYIDIYGSTYDEIVAGIEDRTIDYSNYVNKYWQNARDTHPSVKEHFIFYKVFERAWIDKYGVENQK
jgi:hypothetical protein